MGFTFSRAPRDRLPSAAGQSSFRKLPDAIPKVVSPTGGQGRNLDSTLEQVPIGLLPRIQPGDVGDREPVAVALDQLDRIPGLHGSLAHDREVEAGATAAEEPFDDVPPSEFETELVTWESGVRSPSRPPIQCETDRRY